MLEKTYPDSALNSFRGDNAQESGSTDVQRTSENCTAVDSQNQAAPSIVAGRRTRRAKARQPGQFVGTGNRCGHTPEFLRDARLKAEARRPIIIQKLVRGAERLYHRARGSQKGHGELILVRSEGRESLVQCAQKLLYDLELSTMTVRNNDITFSKPTLRDMTSDANETGLSYSRAKRAQKRLVDGGYLRVTRSPKYVNGEFKADPSEREVTPKLFRVLGLNQQEYSFQKHYKTKRLEKKGLKNFQKEMIFQFAQSLSSGQKDPKKETKGVKTGSFPERAPKEDPRHRQNIIGLYVELSLKLSPGAVSAGMLRNIAEKMTTDNMIAFLKRHTRDTS